MTGRPVESWACICGDAEAHTISRRTTADGYHVLLHEQGSITGAMGYAIRGVPCARPRTPDGVAVALRVGALLMGEVCLYDLAELPALYAAARKVAARYGLPGDLRAEMAREREPHVLLRWQVMHADRDGRPTVRIARLPRLRWPGTYVWHESGRYEVMRQLSALHGSAADAALTTTGFAFATQRELFAWLLSDAGSITS